MGFGAWCLGEVLWMDNWKKGRIQTVGDNTMLILLLWPLLLLSVTHKNSYCWRWPCPGRDVISSSLCNYHRPQWCRSSPWPWDARVVLLSSLRLLISASLFSLREREESPALAGYMESELNNDISGKMYLWETRMAEDDGTEKNVGDKGKSLRCSSIRA